MAIAILQLFINGGHNKAICFHTTIILTVIIYIYILIVIKTICNVNNLDIQRICRGCIIYNNDRILYSKKYLCT
jgi:hypothetical protein